MDFNLPLVLSFGCYLLLILLIAIKAYRSTETISDYVLGGRKLGPVVTALSTGASDMSGWLLLGLPGAIYLTGISELWIGVGLVIGAWFNWQLVAAKLRTFTEKANNALTLPDYLEYRFSNNNGVLRLLSAVVIVLFFTFYVSSGLVGGAILFEKVFQLDYHTALLFGALIIVAYTLFGGFLAVSWTDLFQGLLMSAALIALPIAAISELGGLDTMLNQLTEHQPEKLDLWQGFSWIGFLSLMAWGLGYFGQPHILARFMAISSSNEVPKARNVAMSWMLISLVGAISVGLVGAMYYADSPLENPETVFIMLTQAIFNPWVAGILIAAILSAIMSTIDSQLLVSSSVIVEDFYKKFVEQDATDGKQVMVGRVALAAIAIIAIAIAWDPQSSVLSLVSYAWAGFGAAFGPTILLSLYWQGYSSAGALASLISGALVVVIWKPLTGGIFDLYELLPGFIIAMVAGILVSKLMPSNEATVRYNALSNK